MPAKRLSMRKIKEVLRLKWGQGTEQQEDCRRLWHCASHRQVNICDEPRKPIYPGPFPVT